MCSLRNSEKEERKKRRSEADRPSIVKITLLGLDCIEEDAISASFTLSRYVKDSVLSTRSASQEKDENVSPESA